MEAAGGKLVAMLASRPLANTSLLGGPRPVATPRTVPGDRSRTNRGVAPFGIPLRNLPHLVKTSLYSPFPLAIAHRDRCQWEYVLEEEEEEGGQYGDPPAGA